MTDKARVTQIKYAGLEFEGLMLPSGEYAIALAQFSVVFLESRKISVTQLKKLTSIDFKSHQCSDYVMT